MTERDYPDSADRRGEWTLAADGPEFRVQVSVHPVLAQELMRRGDTPPPPVEGMALVDTGASQTLVDERIVEQLSIPPMGTQRLRTFLSGDPVTLSTHFLRLELGNERPWEGIVVAAPLAVHRKETIVLVGRDLLRHARFVYDGRRARLLMEIR